MTMKKNRVFLYKGTLLLTLASFSNKPRFYIIKKNAQYLSYASLGTFELSWGMGYYGFQAGYFFDIFFAKDDQKAKLVSAHPPNSQKLMGGIFP